jgi:hypothetical protein
MADFIYGPSFEFGDFTGSGGIINRESLANEVAASIGKKPWIQLRDTGCDVRFDEETTQEEDDLISDVVAIHTGEQISEVVEPIYSMSEDESTNDTETFASKLSHSLDEIVSCKYRISWSFEYKRDGAADEMCQVRVRLDDTTIGLTSTGQSEWRSGSGFYLTQIGPCCTPVLDIYFKKLGAGANSAKIRRARIIIERIGEAI